MYSSTGRVSVRQMATIQVQAVSGIHKAVGFTSSISSPYYPQSNGKAEVAVKSMKKIIRAAWNGRHLDEKALLQYRNTPSRRDRLSPAQKLYGHPVQDTLPAH